MSNFQYFTVTIGLSTESEGEVNRSAVLAMLRDDVMNMALVDDDGATWMVHSLREQSDN